MAEPLEISKLTDAKHTEERRPDATETGAVDASHDFLFVST